jgi:hypothetical protein
VLPGRVSQRANRPNDRRNEPGEAMICLDLQRTPTLVRPCCGRYYTALERRPSS